MPRKPQTDQEVAKDILRYFLRHPKAADSLEGVARFRLLDETVHQGVAETEKGLNRLVAQGFLDVSSRGSRIVYCLNPNKRAEAAGSLNEPDEVARSD